MRREAVAFFCKSGWTLEQAAGICANLEAESGWNHQAVGDDPDGPGVRPPEAYGLAQWHGDRQALFEGRFGRDIRHSTFEDQLYNVHAELQSNEKHAGELLAKCVTPAEAAEVICRYYERPKDKDGESIKRAALAQRIYDEAKAQPAPENAPEPQIKPIPPRENAVPLLAALLPTVLQLFAPRAQVAISKITGQPAELSQAFIADLFNKIQTETGKSDPVQAVAKLQEAPAAVVQEVQEHALDYLDKLAPVMEKLHKFSQDEWSASEDSIDRAAVRSIQQQAQEGGPFANPSFLIAVFVLSLVATVVIAVLFVGHFSSDMQALVIGTVLGPGLTGVLAFYFGSSRNSAAKDATISRLAEK